MCVFMPVFVPYLHVINNFGVFMAGKPSNSARMNRIGTKPQNNILLSIYSTQSSSKRCISSVLIPKRVKTKTKTTKIYRLPYTC